MTPSPAALSGDRRPLAPGLPTELCDLGGWAPAEASDEDSGSLTLFLTIDTEDAYFRRPHLMTGDGIGPQHGVFGILDELDARSLAATFFVNVYETERQPQGAVERVVRAIAERGHEVGLHTHPSPALDFYQRPLFRLEPKQQADVIRWGVDLIEGWLGAPPTSFRAGGYALDDRTFKALEGAGIAIDSSCFFPSPNNHLEPRFTVNRVTGRGELVEVPVTTVLRLSAGGAIEHRKLDLDWLSTDQMSSALAVSRGHGGRFAMFMMHSFSFIDKATRLPEDEPSPKALFTSEPLFNRYVEIYGPKPAMREAFAEFLDRVGADPSLHVRTLRDALPELRAAASTAAPDVIPIVAAG